MKLRLMNDPILRQVAIPVTPEELEYVCSLVPEMTQIMKAEGGTGLAANQVGISKRFFIIKQINDMIDLIINPEIVEMGPLEKFEEGCLSIPGTSAETQRAITLTLRFHNEVWQQCEQKFTGIEAVAVQHEIDHLNGKLYIDQLQPVRRMLTVNKYKKYIKLKERRK